MLAIIISNLPQHQFTIGHHAAVLIAMKPCGQDGWSNGRNLAFILLAILAIHLIFVKRVSLPYNMAKNYI